jgi:hypothetical protein
MDMASDECDHDKFHAYLLTVISVANKQTPLIKIVDNSNTGRGVHYIVI